jgi:CRP-like cAMP-binding protein
MKLQGISSDTLTSEILNGNQLFNGLTGQQLAQLAALMSRKRFLDGDYVFHEGDPADELFVILGGEVEVLKKESETQSSHRLTTLQRGASIGEVALLDGNARSASVRALGNCELLSLRIADLETHHSSEESLAACLKVNLGAQLAKNMRNLSETTATSLQEQLQEARARTTAGIFVISTFITICGFVFVVQILAQLIHSKISTSLLSVPLFIIGFIIFLQAVKRSGQPVANYGVTTRNWQKSVWDACIFSIPLMALTVLVKWLLIRFHPGMHGDGLFEIMHKAPDGLGLILLEAFVYLLFTPFQEFIVRGSIQGFFEDFLLGKHKVLKSILIANLMYSMLHLYMSVLFSVMVFIPGLVWGWLYSRQRTLVGVSLSHALVGEFAFFVVGFDTLIQLYG